MSSSMLVRTSRDALLRPLSMISKIVDRRHMPVWGSITKVIERELAKTHRRAGPSGKAKSSASSASTTNSQGVQVAPGADSSGGDAAGDGDDDGGGDSDGPRPPPLTTSSSSRAVRRKSPVRSSPHQNPHCLALLTLAFLAVLAFAMAFVLAEHDHLLLAGEAIASLGGLPSLARTLVRPK